MGKTGKSFVEALYSGYQLQQRNKESPWQAIVVVAGVLVSFKLDMIAEANALNQQIKSVGTQKASFGETGSLWGGMH